MIEQLFTRLWNLVKGCHVGSQHSIRDKKVQQSKPMQKNVTDVTVASWLKDETIEQEQQTRERIDRIERFVTQLERRKEARTPLKTRNN